jgi:hypothetical protein
MMHRAECKTLLAQNAQHHTTKSFPKKCRHSREKLGLWAKEEVKLRRTEDEIEHLAKDPEPEIRKLRCMPSE